MYNFLVYICKNHSTTYKLIIIFLFHSVKQINYSYWKTCESSRLVKYTYNIDQISSTTEFQSTASSQKATGISYRQYAYRFKFQSTSSSQKATNAIHPVRYAYKISIHSFLAESDMFISVSWTISSRFQSTASSQKATAERTTYESQTQFQSTASSQKATPTPPNTSESLIWFQSTASSQKATISQPHSAWDVAISIHSFLAESDYPEGSLLTEPSYFNPQLPRRKRRETTVTIMMTANFNPQLPRRKRHSRHGPGQVWVIFQSTASSQKATAKRCMRSLVLTFQSTASSQKATS